MTDTITTNSIIAEYSAAYFINANKAIHCAYMPFDGDFAKEVNNYNVGSTLTFQLPTYTNRRTGVVASPQDLTERTRTITLDRPVGADWNPGVLELTTDMDSNEKIIDRFVKPSIIGLANDVDKSLTDQLALSVYNVSGTPGTPVNSFATFNTASKVLDKFGVQGEKMALMNITDSAALQNSLSNFFNDKLNSEIDIQGRLGELAGVEIFQDQNIGSHTNGTFPDSGGGITLKTTSVTGATSLVIQGMTASQTGVLKEGDIITVANVFAVNPVSLAAIGAGTADLAKFIVTADVDSDGAGEATVPISPTITFATGNPYNNVSALPAAGAAISLIGGASTTYNNNYIFTKDAILLAIKPYFKPLGLTAGAYGSFADKDTGLNFSVIDWFDGVNFTNLKRLDLLYGFVIQPEYVVRVVG